MPDNAQPSVLTNLRSAVSKVADGAQVLGRSAMAHSHYVVPAINGFFGDKLAEADHPLAIDFALRQDNENVTVDELGLDAAATGAARTVVVFVHGLMADEIMWLKPLPGTPGLGPKLAEATGITPLYLRFNSGMHISLLGQKLAQMLEELSSAWADAIDRIILVGHSQGGLIIESATHYAQRGKLDWPAKTKAIFLMGTPLRGAYLEQFSHAAATVLKRILTIQTYAIGSVIDFRSDGIKDLRLGYLVDEDWQRPNANSPLTWDRTMVESLDDTHYHVMAATLSANEDSWVANILGDGMVGRHSAYHGKRVQSNEETRDNISCVTFPRTSHAGMALSDEVHQYVIRQVAALVAA